MTEGIPLDYVSGLRTPDHLTPTARVEGGHIVLDGHIAPGSVYRLPDTLRPDTNWVKPHAGGIVYIRRNGYVTWLEL